MWCPLLRDCMKSSLGYIKSINFLFHNQFIVERKWFFLYIMLDKPSDMCYITLKHIGGFMNKVIGSLCRHKQTFRLGIGVVMYEYVPPFDDRTHQSQRHKKAYKVHWLQHPDLDVPPILAEHLEDMKGKSLGWWAVMYFVVKDIFCPFDVRGHFLSVSAIITYRTFFVHFQNVKKMSRRKKWK